MENDMRLWKPRPQDVGIKKVITKLLDVHTDSILCLNSQSEKSQVGNVANLGHKDVISVSLLQCDE